MVSLAIAHMLRHMTHTVEPRRAAQEQRQPESWTRGVLTVKKGISFTLSLWLRLSGCSHPRPSVHSLNNLRLTRAPPFSVR